jgi:hypothetical protein
VGADERWWRRRLVRATGVLGERVPAGGVGPGPRPAARFAVLAAAAATAESLRVAQRAEKFRVGVDLRQRPLPDVPGGEREEPARLYVAAARDEDDTTSVAHGERRAAVVTAGAGRPPPSGRGRGDTEGREALLELGVERATD